MLEKYQVTASSNPDLSSPRQKAPKSKGHCPMRSKTIVAPGKVEANLTMKTVFDPSLPVARQVLGPMDFLTSRTCGFTGKHRTLWEFVGDCWMLVEVVVLFD